jgi:hypothetical protein
MNAMPKWSRRAFLTASAAWAAGLRAMPLPVAPLAAPLSLVGHRDVQLLDGPLRTQFIHQQDLFLGLDEDALLKPFRQRAGQAAPGADMGGWYDASADFHCEPNDPHVDFHGFIPGHSFGQYVSGLSRGFAATGDVRTQAKIRSLLDGYRATISPAFFDDYNLPCYTYDKLLIGLIDARHHAGYAAAGEGLDALTEAALPALPEKALTREERRRRPYKREAQIWDEPYTLPENLLLAYERGFGDRYRALGARYIQDEKLFAPLARGENVLGGLHAYSHVNAFSSAVQSYLTLGQGPHLAAALNGFSMLQAQSYATGGWGPDETLAGDDGGAALYASLERSHSSFETPCGAYGHFKIARHLLRLTGDSRYGDSMERVLYNTVLGAKATEPDGRTFYYSDYNDRGRKAFHHDRWPCCSGTFVQLTADYGVSAYLAGPQALYVNLYVPSRVSVQLSDHAVTMTQETAYPREDAARFELALTKPVRFTLAFRIPGWAGPATRLSVNGRRLAAPPPAGRFAEIERVWHPGDRLELILDQRLRLEPLSSSHADRVALMHGPRALFALSHLEATPTRADLLSARPNPSGDDEWRTDGGLLFRPFTAIADEEYRLYTAPA